jgi:asparagine synthase (glutamine-hydrolysing)
LFWQRLIPNATLSKLFAPIWGDVKHVWTRDIFREVFLTHDNELDRPEDYINHSLYFEAKTFLHGLFVVEDKLSMAHGLETRVSFMDNYLVDFAMRCPVNFKLSNLAEVVRINENEPGAKPDKYFRNTGDGKQILRDMLQNAIPTDILSATKQGFSAPDASWFQGESIDFVKKCLYGKNARIYEFLDRNTVKSLVDEHLEGKQNRRLLIWSMLNIEQLFGTLEFTV